LNIQITDIRCLNILPTRFLAKVTDFNYQHVHCLDSTFPQCFSLSIPDNTSSSGHASW